MKGYITNGICYIFPQEAAQIPEVEADVFYVQQEDYAAWVTANESLADKLVKYNYNILAVRPKPFAGHTDDDLEPAPEPTPVFGTLNLSQDAEYNISASVETDTDWTGNELYAQDENMNFVVKLIPDENDATTLVLDENYDGNIVDAEYLDANPTGTCSIYNSLTEATYENVAYSWTNGAAQKEDPELAWSVDAWEVTIGADDNIYAELSNPHSVSPIVYSSSDEGVATINESTGEVTLVAAGVTNLQASFAGDDTYEAQTVTYALTVNAAQEPQTVEYDYNMYATDDPSDTTAIESGTFTSDGVADTVEIDGDTINLVPCTITSATQGISQVGAVVYVNEDDWQYIDDTSTRVSYYDYSNDQWVQGQGYLEIATHQPE